MDGAGVGFCFYEPSHSRYKVQATVTLFEEITEPAAGRPHYPFTAVRFTGAQVSGEAKTGRT